MRGVVALDVEGRVGLGIAQPLRVLEAGVERQPLRLHAGQDVVAGAVEDAEHARHRIAGHRLAHGLDDRDAAGDRRLVVEEHALLLGDLGKRDAMPGEQRLVGGDDMAAGLERGLDRRARRALLAADQLDEHVDVAALGKLDRIVEPFGRAEIDAAVAAARARRNAGHDELAAALAGQLGGLLRQRAHDRSADRAEAGNPDAQCFRHDPNAPRLFDE